MYVTYKTVIESVVLALTLVACATGETAGGDGNAGRGNVSVGPTNAGVTPCVNMPGSTSGDCQIQGDGQMTPRIRK